MTDIVEKIKSLGIDLTAVIVAFIICISAVIAIFFVAECAKVTGVVP